MAIIVNIMCIVLGVVIGLFGNMLMGHDDRHDEKMEVQHYELYQEIRDTKVKVQENGCKLDILLNIATNSLNGDFRR